MGISVDITFKAKNDINYINYKEVYVQGITGQYPVSNINKSRKKIVPFILDQSTLGSQITNQPYPGIISQSPFVNGENIYYIYVRDCNVNYIRIYFDEIYGQYATSVRFIGDSEDITVSNDNNEYLECSFTNYQKNLVIAILEWSKTNHNIIINAIIAGYSETRTYTERDVKNLVCSQEITGDNTLPHFGFIGQYGSLKLMDRNNELLTLMKNNYLRENSLITINYNDNLIGNFYSKKWSYEEKTNSFNVELEDKNTRVNDIIVPKQDYKSRITCLEILNNILSYGDFPRVVYDEVVANKLATYVYIYYFNECSLYEALNKLCNFLQVCMFINQDGYLEVVDYV